MIYDLMKHDTPGFKRIVFPDGQIHYERDKAQSPFIVGRDVCVECRIATPADLFELACFLDAMQRNHGASVLLNVWYCMGARMDRSINMGALTAKVVADMINALPLVRSVRLFEPHSDVLPALINNCSVMDSGWLIDTHMQRNNIEGANIALVAPDDGATKRVLPLAPRYGLLFAQGKKHRDTNTGALSGFSIEPMWDMDKQLLARRRPDRFIIVDDICDGGGTFAGLGEVIKGLYPEVPVDLVVSHGLFTKGCKIDNIDLITTTNSTGIDFEDLGGFTEAFNVENVT